jgi:signal-transduction protein with cAMP-binding, CBS, and nucleotidyltransferase domain
LLNLQQSAHERNIKRKITTKVGRTKSRRARNIKCKAHISAGADPVKDMGVHMHMYT